MIEPSILMKGSDFHIEATGISVMKDLFHFDEELAVPKALAYLLAKQHSVPTE